MPINRTKRGQATQGGEAGFTMVEMIIVMVLTSILGTFTFQIITNSLRTQKAMSDRKERSDDAVMVLEDISREVREAKSITTGTGFLVLEKNVTSYLDSNLHVRFLLSSNKIKRYSATTSLLLLIATGKVVAENVSAFTVSSVAGGGGSNRVEIVLTFTDGSDWETKVYPMNYGL